MLFYIGTCTDFGFNMTKNADKASISHERFEKTIDAINHATTIEELLESVTSITPISMACYFYFAAVGSFEFKGLTQYHAYKMPTPILNHLKANNTHKTDKGIEAVFSKGQFMWLTDLENDPTIIDIDFSKRLKQVLAITGDGLCIPLYGPNNRYGYLFMNLGRKKSECSPVFGFQVQALAQNLHVRYCLMLEKLHKTVKLSQRESQVLELICFGKTNTEIGHILKISPNTVAGYVKQIFLKLEVSDRVSAAMRAQTIKVAI